MKTITKLQLALLQSRIKAALATKGKFHMRGLSLAANGRSLSIGAIKIKSSVEDLEFAMYSVESIQEDDSKYELEVELNDLKFIYRENSFTIEELKLVGLADIKNFYLDIKGLIDALK